MWSNEPYNTKLTNEVWGDVFNLLFFPPHLVTLPIPEKSFCPIILIIAGRRRDRSLAKRKEPDLG